MRDLMPLFRNGNPLIPNSPKQLNVVSCKPYFACELNALWHSRFPVIHWSNVVRNRDYCCFIAIYDDFVYAVAIWSSPIAANRMKEGISMLELRRLAIAPDAPKFTASWMLSAMRKKIKKSMLHIKTLISYQDTDVHSGTIYKASGWIAANTSKEGMDWRVTRSRNNAQSLAPKTRWELKI